MSVYEGQVLDQSKGVILQLVTDTDAHFSHFMPVKQSMAFLIKITLRKSQCLYSTGSTDQIN